MEHILEQRRRRPGLDAPTEDLLACPWCGVFIGETSLAVNNHTERCHVRHALGDEYDDPEEVPEDVLRRARRRDRERIAPEIRNAIADPTAPPPGEVWSSLGHLHIDAGCGHGPAPVWARSWLADGGELVTLRWCPSCDQASVAAPDDVPGEHWRRVEDVLGVDTPG